MGTHDVKHIASALQEVPPRVDEKRKICNGPELKSCRERSGPLEMGSLKEGNKGCDCDGPENGGSEGCTLTPPVKGSEGCTLTPPLVSESGGRTPMLLQQETVGPLVSCEDSEPTTVYMEKWIIDSGSAYDLIKRGKAERQFKCILQDSGKARFDTANGRTASNDRVVFIEQMPVNVKPWLLEHTPVVLSLGKRCLQDGFDFVWKRFEMPCFVRPNGTALHWKLTAWSLA